MQGQREGERASDDNGWTRSRRLTLMTTPVSLSLSLSAVAAAASASLSLVGRYAAAAPRLLPQSLDS